MYQILLFTWFSATFVAADDGDDFTNNLFSDLAPLLALFGERVTMQFMSQSMGIADNIILAMAPLGIITAIVSAIRVGGPSWLKAMIGRARENLAVAEADLMSSTSQEVCELWNGQEIVRCMGSAPVTEFICLIPKSFGAHAGSNPEVISLKKALDLGYLIKTELNFRGELLEWWKSRKSRDRTCRWWNSPKAPRDLSDSEKHEAPRRVIIIRNISDDAPNISLNSHRQLRRGELRIVATLGVVLQLGVLVYSGFATYYPTMRFQKNDTQVATYSYPCLVAGTLILALGMILCGHVVESSTTEQFFQPMFGMEARTVWLQQKKTVSDQVFKSCAVYAQDGQRFITTSRRLLRSETNETVTLYTADNPLNSNNQPPTKSGDHSLSFGVETVLGTIITLFGFVVQFIGLRGMHWSASIAQLSAVLFMVCLKAWVRRGLAKPPMSQPLSPGFELDWFSKTLGKIDEAPWYNGNSGNKAYGKPRAELRARFRSSEWRIMTGSSPFSCDQKSKEQNNKLGVPEAGRASMITTSTALDAQKVLEARKHLGFLAGWRGPAATEAISLARAIEAAMSTIFGSSPTKSSGVKFSWSLEAYYTGSKSQGIQFHVNLKDGRWTAHAGEHEAALSLWLSSVDSKEKEMDARFSDSGEDDSWLRAKGPSGKRSLRLLGSNTPSLLQDLRWWVPRGMFRVFTVREEQKGNIKMENHRIFGLDQGEHKEANPFETATRFTKFEINDQGSTDNATTKHASETEEGSRSFLATESYSPLPLLYAQCMFSAFMHALAKTLTGTSKKQENLFGGAEIHHDDRSSFDSWKHFTHRNSKLSSMIRDIENTGLGTLEDIYLIVIPALSESQKLPQADTAIIELAREHARPHEKAGRWREAAEVYLWLFETAKALKERHIFPKATAILFEYLRQITSVVSATKALHEKTELLNLEEVKSAVEEELESQKSDGMRKILSSLMSLYKAQGRDWPCELHSQQIQPEENENSVIFDPRQLHHSRESTYTTEDRRAKDIHNWTPLHYMAISTEYHAGYTLQELIRGGSNVNAHDLAGWTPIHYACQSGNSRNATLLIRGDADINVQGRDGNAPLHCAAKEGHLELVRVLISAGANPDVLDVLGNTPLLWASYKGHQRVLEYLWDETNKSLRDNIGRSALHLAASLGKVEVVEWLASKKETDKEDKDRQGRTPLHLAAMNGHEAAIEQLIASGAKTEASDKNSWTPLHWAAMNGHEAAIEQLIASGAKTEASDKNSWTPLHWAARNRHVAAVKLLVKICVQRKAGIEEKTEDHKSNTPLRHALNNEMRSISDPFIHEWTGLDSRTKLGVTPLGLAASHGHEDVVNLLIDNGAMVITEDQFGNTPLHYAAKNGKLGTVKLLIKHGADKQARNNRGKTPLGKVKAKRDKAVARGLESNVERCKETLSLLE